MIGRAKHTKGKADKKLFLEATIQYSEEQVNEYLRQAEKDLETVREIFKKMLFNVQILTIGDIQDDKSSAEKYLDTVQKTTSLLYKKVKTYLDVADRAETEESSESVSRLNTVIDEIDNYVTDLGRIEDAIETMLSSAEKLTNFYNKG